MDLHIPIREIAHHFGVPVSTLHYWERRGLVHAQRRGTWRYYDVRQAYRIALIQRWRRYGLMSIEEIGDLLDVSTDWKRIVEKRIADVDAQLAGLMRAREYLTHLSTCPHGPDLENCREFRMQIDLPRGLSPAGDVTHASS